MSAWGIAIVLVVSVVGSFIQGSVGFGHNLIAAPVFALVDPDLVPGPAIASAFVLVALTMARDHQGLHLGEVGTAVIGRVPGTLLAAAALAALPAAGISVAFAVIVLVAVAMTASGLHLHPDRRTLLAAGALSGFMGTVSSIGGPPMAMVYAGQEGRRMRGTLAGFFMVGTVMSVATLAASGSFGAHESALSLVPIPGILAGFGLSGWGARRLDAGHTRVAVLTVSALGAVSVLVKSLL